MTVSQYVQLIETKHQTLLGLDDDQLLVVSNARLPRSVALALVGLAPQLVRYFQSGVDRDLSITLRERELKALGLIRIGYDRRLTHPDGDEIADQIIAGVLDHDDAERDTLDRNRRTSQFLRALRDRH